MKSVILYYFSGTGNTEIVVNMLKEDFLMQGCIVKLVKIEDVLKNNLPIDFDSFDYIGIGSNVIGFGFPKIVRDFIKYLPNGKDKKTFILRTTGGVAPINYNASKLLIRKLSKKGFDVFYERLFSISSNWINRFDNEIIIQLYEATRRKVTIMCKEILEEKPRFLKTGKVLRFRMGIIRRVSSVGLRIEGKDMYRTKACTNCGLCVKICPAGNLYEKNGKIKSHFNCSTCLRCVYACPKQAIDFRFAKFFVVKGGYDINKILKNPDKPYEFASGNVPKFFDSYIKDDSI